MKELLKEEMIEKNERRSYDEADEMVEKEHAEERDFDREIRELIEKYPELGGKSLPDEVVLAALDGMDLTKAYEAYRAERSNKESAHAGKEKNAFRAPVRGVSGGEAVRMQGEDDFLRGFNA